MIDARQLAGKAHHAIVQDIITMQARILLRKQLRAEFGADAVEPLAMLAGRRSVTGAAEITHQADLRDRERLAELIETAKAMEAVFAEKEAADMADFAAYWAERFRARD